MENDSADNESQLENLNSNEKKIDEIHLETLQQYQQRWTSIRIMYYTVFLMSLGFSIIITGILPYLRQVDSTATNEFLGYLVAAHPFAQMIFSPIIGWWGNKLGKARFPLLVTCFVFTISSMIYACVEIFENNRRYWMLAARFFVGASSANIAICRSYVSAATKLAERTKAVSMISLAQILGFVVGPGLQAACTPLGETGFVLFEKLKFNMYTISGWINAVMGIINFILLLPFFFKERTIITKEAMLLNPAKTEKDVWKNVKPDYLSAWSLVVAFFILTFNFVFLESLGTVLVMDQFAWTDQQALSYLGIIMSVGAVAACFITFCINPVCKRFGEINVLIYGGFLFMVVGRAVYLPITTETAKIAYILNATLSSSEHLGCPETQAWCFYTPRLTISQFIFGFALTIVGYPIGTTLIQAIFSKVLGPRPQGLWMGILTCSGCLSRVVGPVCVVSIYTNYGPIYTFGPTAVIMLVTMIFVMLIKKRLQDSCLLVLGKETENTKQEIELVDFEVDI